MHYLLFQRCLFQAAVEGRTSYSEELRRRHTIPSAANQASTECTCRTFRQASETRSTPYSVTSGEDDLGGIDLRGLSFPLPNSDLTAEFDTPSKPLAEQLSCS